MDRPLIAVLLAGAIRPSPLQEALGMPVVCMPVGRQGTVLEAWIAALAERLELRTRLTDVQVVVNTQSEAEAVSTLALSVSENSPLGAFPRIVAEPAAWRGAAGILRDVTERAPQDAVVLVCEAKRLPPNSVLPLVQAIDDPSDRVAGVVGVCGADEPAGVYAFTRTAIQQIPNIGYVDLKEQFLPALKRRGFAVAWARLGDAVWRMRDLESYLEAVSASLSVEGEPRQAKRISNRASISGSAVLDGFCIVESGAIVEDGAVVHDCVVFPGATVGGGAIVSRSVIGPQVYVEPRSRVIKTCLTQPPHGEVAVKTNREHRMVGEQRPW